jgi:WD40 repeat protein
VYYFFFFSKATELNEILYSLYLNAYSFNKVCVHRNSLNVPSLRKGPRGKMLKICRRTTECKLYMNITYKLTWILEGTSLPPVGNRIFWFLREMLWCSSHGKSLRIIPIWNLMKWILDKIFFIGCHNDIYKCNYVILWLIVSRSEQLSVNLINFPFHIRFRISICEFLLSWFHQGI